MTTRPARPVNLKPMVRKLLLASLLLLAAGSAAAGASVVYVHPENFSDIPRAPREREQVFRELGEHVARLAAALPAGQALRVDVLDLDLAGRIEPTSRHAYDLRMLTGGADWPHIHLRYTLEANGQVLANGEEHLSNMMYQDRLSRHSSGDPLRYEKQMIDDWFRTRFLPHRPG